MARGTKTIVLILILLLLALAAGCADSSGGAEEQGGEIASAPESQDQAEQPSPGGMQLLTNGDFSSGLSGWEIIDQGGSRAYGTNLTELVSTDGTAAARFYRTCPEKDGGAAGIKQPLNAQAESGQRLTLSARVKVDNEKGGAIAGSDPRWYPEGAVQFRIYYEYADGETGEWYHGFYYGDVEGADTSHFTQVTQGEWQNYSYSNLGREIIAEAGEDVTITEFRAYGFGWDFEGYTSNLSLVLTGGE